MIIASAELHDRRQEKTNPAGSVTCSTSFATWISWLRDGTARGPTLTLPCSSGKVEGTVNKIKTVKRQMYGRASFALLRKRVILHPA